MLVTILSSRWKPLAFVLVLAVSSCTAAPYQQVQSSPKTGATGVAAMTPASVEVSNPVAAATPLSAEAPNPSAAVTPIAAETMSNAPSAGMEISTTVAAAPAGQALAQGGVLYQDDFTDPKSGWPNNLEFGNYYIGYHEPNHYHVEVHVPHDRAVVAVPKRSFTDFTMESKVMVAPNNTAKTGDFRYGLVFRRSGNQYYAFVVSPRTKSWYVLKSSPNGLVELKKGSDDSIQGLTAEDTLRVDVKGSNFFFHINDQAIGQVGDADYATGEEGFLVETLDSPRAHIHYGTTTIRDVEAPQLECTVITQALKVRAGPGTMYNTIATARRGARFEPLARNTDGFWIYVRTGAGDGTAWISSSPGLVYCSVPVDDLAVRQP
jgi:hypothetical protein